MENNIFKNAPTVGNNENGILEELLTRMTRLESENSDLRKLLLSDCKSGEATANEVSDVNERITATLVSVLDGIGNLGQLGGLGSLGDLGKLGKLGELGELNQNERLLRWEQFLILVERRLYNLEQRFPPIPINPNWDESYGQ